jgi:hypothetical protein
MSADPTTDEKDARGAKIAILSEEAYAIHFANQLYWKRKDHSQEASAEYERRQARLEGITRELTEVQSSRGQEALRTQAGTSGKGPA